MKMGRMGMITLVTIFNTISWNSWSTLEMVFALTQVAARPIRIENTRALMTLMMAGISSWKIASGTSFRPSTVETMRSEEHTSELQSRFDVVCRLLLEKTNT